MMRLGEKKCIEWRIEKETVGNREEGKVWGLNAINLIGKI
jgi:hypothetical protein